MFFFRLFNGADLKIQIIYLIEDSRLYDGDFNLNKLDLNQERFL
jgi:hypothetical protein